MGLLTQVKEFIKKEKLLKKGDFVLIGVSGGADSVCLSYILNELKYEFGITVALAHFNHNLRKSAVRDEKYIRELALKLNIPLYVGKWEHKNKIKGSLEDKAREERLKFLIKTAKNIKANVIALAHNKNDVAETVLMRILRGSGLQGLRTIMPQKVLYNFKFIRPLIETNRKIIESHLKKKNVKYCCDETNQETKYDRNKIRHDLIPYLKKKYSSNLDDVLYNLSRNVSCDYDYLSQIAEQILQRQNMPDNNIRISLNAFQKHHIAIRRLLVRLIYEKLNGSTKGITLLNVQELLSAVEEKRFNTIVNLPAGVVVRINKDSIIFMRNNK